jgi:hypothetical protein
MVCLKDVGQRIGDHACLWIAGLTGFRGMVLVEIMQTCAGIRGTGSQSGDRAGLCRPELVT